MGLGYAQPGVPNTYLSASQIADSTWLQWVGIASGAMPPISVGTVTIGAAATLAAQIQPTLAVIPPATFSLAAAPTLNVVPPATLSVVPPATQPVLTQPIATSVDNRFNGGKKAVTIAIATTGDFVVYTPAAGKKLTLYWAGLSSSASNANEIEAKVKLGPTYVVYDWYMGAPGAFSHWEPIPASQADDALIVRLAAAGATILANFSITEG